MKAKKVKRDLYQEVTDTIIAKLEAGVVPWRKPWKSVNGEFFAPFNMVTKKAYKGVNTLILGSTDFECPIWASFKQISAAGGSVKKGSKSTVIVYWNFFDAKKKELDENGNEIEVTRKIPKLLYHTIFNLEQQEGIDWKALCNYDKKEDESTKEFNPIENCEEIINNYKDHPEYRTGGDRACYSPSADYIKLPEKTKFESEEEFYSTYFHEGVHSTGHQKRLNRKFGFSFGDKNYSKEELVAEMGAGMLCAVAGIDNETLDNSASYIKSWIGKLKEDNRLIISASGKAQKAVDYILGE